MQTVENAEGTWEGSLESEFVTGDSSAIAVVNELVSDLAATDIPVLLIGESGTGKEVYARRIHRLSGRAGTQPIKINCRTADQGRLTSLLNDLWSQNRTPEVPASVFLDGLEELNPAAQKVLLAALSESETAHPGGSAMFRLISAAPEDLESHVRNGSFRPELYFRLNGACLRLPPLRERNEDVPKLAEYFLYKHATELGRKVPTLNAEAIQLLRRYHWPGNIRELQNLTKSIAAVGNAEQVLIDLRMTKLAPAKQMPTGDIFSLKIAARAASREREKELILDALHRTRWNRKRAAQELRISYKSLLCKIKQLEMPDAPPRERGIK